MMYDPEIGLSVQNCSTDYRRPTIPFTSFQSLFCVLRKYSLLCDIISSVGRCYLHLWCYYYLYIFFFFCWSRSVTFCWTHCHRFPIIVFLVNWSGGSHRVIICAGIHYNGLTSTLNPSTNLTSPQVRVRELNCTSHFSHQCPFFCGSTGGIAH